MVNDLDVDFSADPKAAASYANDQRNLRKIREHTAKLKVDVVYPFREGKRLLVLDIDYSNCLLSVFRPRCGLRWLCFSSKLFWIRSRLRRARFLRMSVRGRGCMNFWRRFILIMIYVYGALRR